eukprot:6210059-Pleurochrysis_carterae.AAC.1
MTGNAAPKRAASSFPLSLLQLYYPLQSQPCAMQSDPAKCMTRNNDGCANMLCVPENCGINIAEDAHRAYASTLPFKPACWILLVFWNTSFTA